MRLVASAVLVLSSVLAACGGGGGGGGETTGPFASKAALGEALFHDVDLSLNRSQSCATCHDPEHAFTDPRDNGVGGAASLGDDGVSLGDRNSPTAMYQRFAPIFESTLDGGGRGGQFHDGRASDLAAQAAEPPVGGIEMGLADEAAAVARLQEKAEYVTAFKQLYGIDLATDTSAAYAAMADAIATFERESDEFAPFDSKYDRAKRGEYEMTDQEQLGEALFFSNQFASCNTCHQLELFGGRPNELFTDFSYHNIGVPVNTALRAANGSALDRIDHGLLDNPLVTDPIHDGKFKTPTLRNVAVTGPYMHNGVFQDLRTVVLFYDKFNNAARVNNPETGQPWADPEVPATVNLTDLERASSLTDEQVDAIVAFLKLLTDRRYEHLLDE